MLKDVREKVGTLSARPVLGQLMHMAVALMLCVGLLLPLLATLGLPYSTLRVVLLCAGLLAVLQALRLNRWTRRIGMPLLLALGVFALLNQGALMSNLPALVSLVGRGQGLGLALFSGPLVVMLAVLFACISHALVHQPAGFYMAMLLAVGVLLTLWFYGERSALLLCLPALAALGILYASASDAATPYSRSLPMAVLAILLAMLLMPAGKVSSPQMEEGAGRIRDLIYDYFFFTEARSVFSLTTDGYQPLGQDRLGGPVTLSDAPVMQVRTTKPLLLRGTVKDYYTGLVFIDNGSSRRYLMVDPRHMSLRNKLLDMQRPSKETRENSALFTPREIEVQMLAPGVSTIFMPQRFESLSAGSGMVPYFNSTSEVFITRDTAPGDTYTVIGFPITAADAEVEALVAQSMTQQMDAAYLEEVRTRYLQLPESVESQVHGLAEQVTMGAATDFQKAKAIERYLEATYPYTLDQSVPSTHRDFVSWFLLEEQQGYCTSFAAAMTVMARCVGIPARYVEGYLAVPGEDGIARVTGEDAHAWVEVFFEGFGWLPFDPTPGSGSGEEWAGESPESPESAPPMGDMDDSDETVEPPTPTPIPTPTPEPTPTPPLEDDDPPLEATPTPTPTPIPPETDDPPFTPTPSPTPEPTPTPPTDDDHQDKQPRWLWLVGILSLLLLGTGLFLRLRFTNPAFVAGRQRESAQKMLVWYRALQRELQACGIPPNPLESPLKAFEAAEKQLGAKGLLMPVAITVCYVRYGGKEEVTEAALRDAQASYVALKRRMKLRQRLKYLWIRLRYGLGNLKEIP